MVVGSDTEELTMPIRMFCLASFVGRVIYSSVGKQLSEEDLRMCWGGGGGG